MSVQPALPDLSTPRTIWKFSIPFPPKADVFQIKMPASAEPLCVQLQHGEPQLWAVVDSEAPSELRTFRIAGTGHPITENVEYLGSFQVANGSLVFHVFEVV